MDDRKSTGHAHQDSNQAARVRRNGTASRFELVENPSAFLQYRESDSRITLIHTEVPPELRRRGYGSELVHEALEYARRTHLAVRPVCPFARIYLSRHPEYGAMVEADAAGSNTVEP